MKITLLRPFSIVLDSTNKTAIIKFPLVIWGVLKVPWKNSSNRNATGYKWVLVLAQHVTNTHLYPVALRFDEFFHGIFKTPQITNGNLIIAVLLVESNTMGIFVMNLVDFQMDNLVILIYSHFNSFRRTFVTVVSWNKSFSKLSSA